MKPKKTTAGKVPVRKTAEPVKAVKTEKPAKAEKVAEQPAKRAAVPAAGGKEMPGKVRQVAVPKKKVAVKVAGKAVSRSSERSGKTPVAEGSPSRLGALPQVLFQGDHVVLPSVSGPGRRYALGPGVPSWPSQVVEELGELPEAYGTKRLFLAARDPHWLYAHWDFTMDQMRESNAQSADRHLVLRVMAGAGEEAPCAEVHVHPESRNWFVHVGRGGTRYEAELGYYRKGDRSWVSLAISDGTMTPPDSVAEEAPAGFATIPIEVPFEALVAVVKLAAKENVPLAEAVMQLAAAGHPGLPHPEEWSTMEWTPAREKALALAVAEAISMDEVRRVWIGSMEITELLRRRLAGPVSSAALVGRAGEEVAGAWEAGGPGSVTSPFGQVPGRRGFWFNVNAELIIYGATEPDATVTIGDRVLKLRPDGSFTFRFALPDGRYELPVWAASADGVEMRGAALEFMRATGVVGDVGEHPQDARLRPPQAEHVG